MNRFTQDGKAFGRGSLFGLPMTGEVVGVYYNKAKLQELGVALPKTFQAFESAREGEGGGETPIQFGNLDKWPGIHTYEEPMLQFVTKNFARSWIFGAGSLSFENAGTRLAATSCRSGRRRATSRTATGLGYDPSWAQFGKGERRLPDHGQLADGRPAQGARQGHRLLPAAAPRREAALDARRRGPAVGDQLEVEERRCRRHVHRLPHASAERAGPDQRGPASGDEGEGQGARRCRHRGLRRLDRREQPRRDRPVPRLGDADDVRHDHGRDPEARRRTTPSRFVDAIQSDYSKFHK